MGNIKDTSLFSRLLFVPLQPNYKQKCVDPDMNISKIQLMDAILKELSADGFTESEASDFWSDFDNLQKAKIIR